MNSTRGAKPTGTGFEVKLPLMLRGDSGVALTFSLADGGKRSLVFDRGLYFFRGDNGSGKTSFFNMLALIAGQVGASARGSAGRIIYNGEAYNSRHFDCFRAAEIREKDFSIFPQKAFFLPVSTRDNYLILNGSDRARAELFSSRENPDLLSGGQQQKILMDIVLDEKKPVWFLDEPLANLDIRRRAYFWKILHRACRRPRILFYIDHWMGPEIENHHQFTRYERLRVSITNELAPPGGADQGAKTIDIFNNPDPTPFFLDQLQKVPEK